MMSNEPAYNHLTRTKTLFSDLVKFMENPSSCHPMDSVDIDLLQTTIDPTHVPLRGVQIDEIAAVFPILSSSDNHNCVYVDNSRERRLSVFLTL